MAKKNRQLQQLSPKEARSEIAALAVYLKDEAATMPATSVGTAIAKRLKWAADCIDRYLNGERDAPSLDSAFGVVARRGNPGGMTRWEQPAADKDRLGLTVAQVIDRLPIKKDGNDHDERSVRKGLARGRTSYRRKAVQAAIDQALNALADEDRAERAEPSRAIQRNNKRDHVRIKRKG